MLAKIKAYWQRVVAFVGMNSSQFFGMFRIFVPVGLTYAASIGWLGNEVAEQALAAISALGSIGWSFVAHTDASNIATVADIPQVQSIVVVKSATNGVAAMAESPDHPKVVKTL